MKRFQILGLGLLGLATSLGYPLPAQAQEDLLTPTTQERITISDTPLPIIEPSLEQEVTTEPSRLTESATNFEPEYFLTVEEWQQSETTTEESQIYPQILSQYTEPIPDSVEVDFGEPVNDQQIFWLILVDELEYRLKDGQDTLNWDAVSWVGGDYERLWIKTEGEVGLEEGDGEAEIQLLYGRLISPFFDLQAGVRYEQLYGDDSRGRAFGVVGVQGLLPYLVEADASLFVSQDGDISARLSAEQQYLLSQRLFLEPSFETNLAIQEVEEFGVGSGLNDIELGLRLRYELNRSVAPYVGVSWTRLLGDTADFAEEEGESVDDLALTGGVRLLF